MKEHLLTILRGFEGLSDNEYPSRSQIYKALGMPKSTFYKLIRDLKADGLIETRDAQRVEKFTRFIVDKSAPVV